MHVGETTVTPRLVRSLAETCGVNGRETTLTATTPPGDRLKTCKVVPILPTSNFFVSCSSCAYSPINNAGWFAPCTRMQN